MKYTFIRDGVPEEVKIERWVWAAFYTDGTKLHQFGDDGIFHQVGEIEQDKIALFSIYKPEDPSKRIDLFVPKGARIIYKYKRYGRMDMPEHEEKAYVLGYKDGDHYHFNYVMPDDRIVQSTTENISLEIQ